MSRAVHVRPNAAVRTVGTTTALLRRVDLNVLDDKIIGVQILEISVALGVPQQVENDLRRLHGPASLAHLEGLRLRGAANAAGVLPKRNALLLLNNVSQVRLSGTQVHAFDGLTALVCVLVVYTKVHAHGFARLAWIRWLSGVLH